MAEVARAAAVRAAWSEALLQKAETLSAQGQSASEIACELGNGISPRSVFWKLYYRKIAKTKLARKTAYERRKALKRASNSNCYPDVVPSVAAIVH